MTGTRHMLYCTYALLAVASPADAQQAGSANDARRTVEAVLLADGDSITLDGRLGEAV